jgi:hypothetical protein
MQGRRLGKGLWPTAFFRRRLALARRGSVEAEGTNIYGHASKQD